MECNIIKTLSAVLMSILLVFVLSACETKKEKRVDACRVIQEKVDQLNLKYGNWGKVPDAVKNEVSSQISNDECTIIGNNTWNDTGFKMKVE